MNTDRQVLLINGAHGVYIPMAFAESEILTEGWNLPQEAANILKAGPEHPDYYEAWAEVLDNAVLQGEHSHTWTLYQSPEGDLYAVRDDWEGLDND